MSKQRPRILIAGAGQIGSRYLQGLSKFPKALEIWLYDISIESLIKARKRWDKEIKKADHVLFELSKIQAVPKKIDLAIISTTADARPNIVKKIASLAKVEFWLLEKVLAQSLHGLKIISGAIPVKATAWVNTPLNLYPLYKKLKIKNKDAPIQAKFSGINGIACNSIHYIDLISRWEGGQINGVETEKLRIWRRSSKRLKFFDIQGELKLTFENGSSLSIKGNNYEKNNNRKFIIMFPSGKRWKFSEREGVAKSNQGDKLIRKHFIHQSEMTPKIIKKILSGRNPDLPTLAQSIEQHKSLLKALLKHWNTNKKIKRKTLPIT